MLDHSTFELSKSRIIEVIRNDLRDSEPGAREAALDRLGGLSGSVAVAMIPHLDDPDAEVRGSAAANLGRVRDAMAIEPLVAAARREGDDDVLAHIMTALNAYQGTSILGVLLDALAARERDYRVRMKVVYQLWKYDASVAVPALAAVLRGDDHELVRLHAAASLATIDRATPTALAAEVFWSLRDSDSPAMATIAVSAIYRRRSKSQSLVDALLEKLGDATSPEHQLALGELASLWPPVPTDLVAPWTEHDEPGMRSNACAALGELRREDAIQPLLVAFVGDPVPTVVRSAALSLESYWTAAIGEALLDAADRIELPEATRAIVLRQLWKYPSSRTTAVVGRCTQSDTGTVRAAASAAASLLGRLV
jgi:HEAT repeat protein